MRTSVVLAVLTLPLLVLAQDKFKPEIKWEKGAKTKYAFTYNFVMSDARADVTGGITSEVKEDSSLSLTYEKVKVIVNDQELDYPFEPSQISLDKSGYLKTISGGIEGGDTARMYLTTLFIPPTEGLSKGESFKKNFEKNSEEGLGEMTYEATYEGPDKVGEVAAHKYTTKYVENGNDFSIKNTVWVTASGKVLKIEGEFSNMPVPAANSIAEGKVKLEISG